MYITYLSGFKPYTFYSFCPLPTELVAATGMGLSVRSSVRLSVCHTLCVPRISGQTAQGINIKLSGYIYYGTLQIWLTFGYAPLSFCCVMASGWWSSFRAFCPQNVDQIWLKFYEPTYSGPPQAWLTFGHVQLNFRRFLASDWLGCFCAFTDSCWLD